MGKSEGAGRTWICQKSLSGTVAISTDMEKRGSDVSNTLMTPQDSLEQLGQPPWRVELLLVGQTFSTCFSQRGRPRRQSDRVSACSLKEGEGGGWALLCEPPTGSEQKMAKYEGRLRTNHR